jgi:hypothetical protein
MTLTRLFKINLITVRERWCFITYCFTTSRSTSTVKINLNSITMRKQDVLASQEPAPVLQCGHTLALKRKAKPLL